MDKKFKGLLIPPLRCGEVFKKREANELSCMESAGIRNGFCNVNECVSCILH